ncbi:CheR family methyltransferase [Desulfonatronovibrio hydrogenovorans]|uniref:CheR family methyltransferase n=1 Tax=Desulfonatronovibrio hydrogenovorans TaxID=53245 RepID=UPI00048C7F4E|nr:protein-glutamate O-methyltransferase [Desulfonatronovibrio hydrogenovorans]
MTVNLSYKKLAERDFKKLSQFISAECGIRVPPAKKTMLESRLQRRLRSLGMSDYKDYCEYLFSLKGMEIEMPHLLDAVTTNTTHFFREPGHFEYLHNKVLPQWHAEHKKDKEMIIWSAGCSSGEEPYTLSMVLAEFAERNPGFSFVVVATDINNEVLEKASLGIYDEERISGIPPLLKRKYLLRSRDRKKKLVRVIPALRNKVKFRRLNFMGEFGFREPMDVIFCRNVMIYFDRPVQEKLLQKFVFHLASGGFIFIGHSESLAGMDLGLEQTAPTIYRKK